MPLFNRKQPTEFVGEMPEKYKDDDEYYGEEDSAFGDDQGYLEESDDYQDDADDDDYEQSEDEDSPRGNPVKTFLIAITTLLFVGVGGYFIATALAPDMVNDLVNNLPFVSQTATTQETPPDAGTIQDATVPPPATQIDPNAASEGVPSADVAAVPPVPAVPKTVNPTPVRRIAPVAVRPAAPVMTAKPAPRARVVVKRVRPASWRYAQSAARYSNRRVRGYGRYAQASRYGLSRYRRGYASYYRGHRLRYATAKRQYRARYVAKAPSRDWVGTYGGGGVDASPAMQWSGGGTRQGDWVGSYTGASRWVAPQPVRADVTTPTRGVGRGRYLVQVGAFKERARAAQLVSDLRARGVQASAIVSRRGLTRVHVGQYPTRAIATSRARQLQRKGVPTAVTAH